MANVLFIVQNQVSLIYVANKKKLIYKISQFHTMFKKIKKQKNNLKKRKKFFLPSRAPRPN